MRETWLAKDITAGCYECNGHIYIWHAANAQAVAARHHDATGHTTWVEVYLHYTYGKKGDA